MVSTEQWWGRGPGIARPKQEALHELQRTGRAEGLSGWSQCQDWRLPEDACQPRDAQHAVGGGGGGVMLRWQGQLGLGQSMPCSSQG